MRKIVIAILWGLSFFECKSQAVTVTIDSLSDVLMLHRTPDSVRVDLLLALSDACLGVRGNEMIVYAQQALHLADSLHYMRGLMMSHTLIAQANFMTADYKNVIDHAIRASILAERQDDVRQMGESYRLLANVYSILGDEKRTAFYFRKTIAAARAKNANGLIARTYCSIGMWFYAKGEIDSAQFYLKEALVIAEKQELRFFKPYILSQLGWTYHTLDLDVAIRYEEEALRLASEIQNLAAKAGILNDLGKIYLLKNDHRKAEKLLMQALELARENQFHNHKGYIYQGLIDLKIAQGHGIEAKKYVDAYIATRDSMINEEKAKQILTLQTRFETEKKEQAIRLLEQEKYTDGLWKKSLVTISILLLVMFGMIYRLQRTNNKKDRELLNAQQMLNQKLRETDSMRSRFFTSISHEFRTPISLIVAPLEAKLKSLSLPQRDKYDLRLVMRNANRLGELVNQLLDLSKLEAGKMEVRATDGSLHALIAPLLASYESLARKRNITFLHDLQFHRSHHAFDHDKFEKIITNLVTNAFKFTSAFGTITVHVRSDDASVSIRIADTGKGIPEQDLPYVFTPFYQSGTTEDHTLPGTGLGLALVHELVRVLKGTIDLQSKPGHGTAITVILPLHSAARSAHDTLVNALPLETGDDEPETGTGHGSFPGALLVVEDNPELRRFISQHFAESFHVLAASNGKEALRLAFDHMPGLVISDVMMPEMDGIELMKAMKADERTEHIPIMLLSAQADHESKIEALELGADEYMTKPFSLLELEARVNSIIKNRENTAAHYRRMISSDIIILPSTVSGSANNSIHARFISKLREYISLKMGDPSFGVEELANEMCLSRTQLFRKVKMVLDTTPSDLISDMRLQQAALMIAGKSDTLAQIAYAVGFREQSYFAKRFRKKFGMSPREYAVRDQINRRRNDNPVG